MLVSLLEKAGAGNRVGLRKLAPLGHHWQRWEQETLSSSSDGMLLRIWEQVQKGETVCAGEAWDCSSAPLPGKT